MKIILDYADKIIIALTAVSSGVCIASSASVIDAPLGIAGDTFTLAILISIGIIKKVLSLTKNKKKKHSKTVSLAKNKLDKIEELVLQLLTWILIMINFCLF